MPASCLSVRLRCARPTTRDVAFGIWRGLLIGTLVATLSLVGAAAAQAEEADPAFACLSEPGPLEIVDGFYGDGKLKPSVEANKKFDARTASFEYPETISHSMVSVGEKGGSGADDMCWAGGFFTASLSWHDLDISWDESKRGYDDTESDRGEMNNTTSITAYEDRFTFTGLHVYNMHDGIRTSNTFNNWTVQHVWLDYIRDDCIENDHIYSGTVYDSLFDGCYAGISARPSSSGDGDGQIINVDRLLLRMEPMPYPYKWDTKDDPVIFVDGYDGVPFGYGKVFKLDSGNEPEFSITNSVFVLEYDSQKTLFPPADKVTTCNNNTIIWFGEPAAAPTYLLDEFPGCFTLITDEAEGKAFWQEKVADWHARHPDVGFDRKPENPGEYSWPRYGDGSPPDPDPDPNPAPTAAFSAVCTDLDCTFYGSGSSDDGNIQRYDWDFGDGNSDSGAVVSHSYASGDTYTVTLTAAAGAADSITQNVTVSSGGGTSDPPTANSAPTGTNTAPADGSSFDESGGSSSDSEPAAGTGGSDALVVSGLSYCGKGGKNSNKHLISIVSVQDDSGAPLANASVNATVTRNGGQTRSGTATTDRAGEAKFSWKNAGTGDFTTEVESVNGDTGVTTPTNGVIWPDTAIACR